jgi:hypothetical protein
MMRFLIRAGAAWGAYKIISKLVARTQNGNPKTKPYADRAVPLDSEAEPHMSSVATGEGYEEAAKKLTEEEPEANDAGRKSANA